jgi:hypothetical protein
MTKLVHDALEDTTQRSVSYSVGQAGTVIRSHGEASSRYPRSSEQYSGNK